MIKINIFALIIYLTYFNTQGEAPKTGCLNILAAIDDRKKHV